MLLGEYDGVSPIWDAFWLLGVVNIVMPFYVLLSFVMRWRGSVGMLWGVLLLSMLTWTPISVVLTLLLSIVIVTLWLKSHYVGERDTDLLKFDAVIPRCGLSDDVMGERRPIRCPIRCDEDDPTLKVVRRHKHLTTYEIATGKVVWIATLSKGYRSTLPGVLLHLTVWVVMAVVMSSGLPKDVRETIGVKPVSISVLQPVKEALRRLDRVFYEKEDRRAIGGMTFVRPERFEIGEKEEKGEMEGTEGENTVEMTAGSLEKIRIMYEPECRGDKTEAAARAFFEKALRGTRAKCKSKVLDETRETINGKDSYGHIEEFCDDEGERMFIIRQYILHDRRTDKMCYVWSSDKGEDEYVETLLKSIEFEE
ncbi:MAG: hypothetical protein II951_00650 [Bacteroidales bacterium]|nr:hypothetical protein [Bacteroidales bacterium]